ncbi:hypothetical protein JL49_20935 [Pseudoalteromonas luteoviolacea]|nr:hypothetical protein JL49_20935 [Pseudoalteromonas luteoviolacea]
MSTFDNNIHDQDIIDIGELARALASHKWFISIFIIFSAIASVAFSLSLPNEYKSDIHLAPVADDSASSLAGLASQFGGLASMAGINLPSGGDDKSLLALETLKSRKFLTQFIDNNTLIEDILAADGWDREANQVTFDSDLYTDGKWVRSPPKNRGVIPTSLEAYETFIDDHLRVSVDDDTGFYRISVIHYSPYWAKEILEKLIFTLEETIKQSDIEEADKSILYINERLEFTNNVDMRNVFYKLLEKQYQMKMLGSVKSEYVFKVIDPPFVAEDKESPSRAIICIVGVILGTFLAVLISLVRYFWKK